MAYQKNCEVCDKVFSTSWNHQQTCSNDCRKYRLNKMTGRTATINRVSSSSVGAMSELVVCAELLKRGYSVFRSVSPSCFCDLIAFKDGATFKIEVRTGYMSNTGNLCFTHNISESADVFGVYERNSGEIYFLDKEKKQIELI